ncbi:ABC transporter substrate-binding protein [Lacrimispora sp. NSJ-141]|uniref:ABC transporter substrate-binding protein n=1 Tax=Lientehia hominis TaxID=2897778 RepID=A0AAP2RKB8_9FIRM|nr:ABC transporter substrate-binding protein [Lientehia hominis]MCD2492978.1 ABC transporter substrate-binding protein [Lientehia hominis]
MRRYRKRMAVMCMVLAMALVFAGCGSKAAEGTKAETKPVESAGPVTIALCIPLSGSVADAGRMAQDGAKLAAEVINENGGIQSLGGAKINLEILDTTSDADQSKNVVERAISGENVVAVVGCGTSALTLPALPVLEKAQIPIVTYSNSAELNNQGYQYVFSISPTAVDVGQSQPKFLKWLNEEKGYDYKKVAIVYENSSNGISTAEGYRKKAEEMGLEIVYDESFQPNLADASSIVTAVKSSGAQVILPSCYANDNKLLVDTMNSMDYHPLWLGVSCWASFGESLGDSANGLIANGNWNHKNSTVLGNPEYVKITEKFEEKFGYFMAEQSGSAFACVQLIAGGLELTGSTDTTALRDALSGNTFDSIMQPGQVAFDETGVNKLATVGVQQWQNGECICIWPEELAGADYIDPSESK